MYSLTLFSWLCSSILYFWSYTGFSSSHLILFPPQNVRLSMVRFMTAVSFLLKRSWLEYCCLSVSFQSVGFDLGIVFVYSIIYHSWVWLYDLSYGFTVYMYSHLFYVVRFWLLPFFSLHWSGFHLPFYLHIYIYICIYLIWISLKGIF